MNAKTRALLGIPAIAATGAGAGVVAAAVSAAPAAADIYPSGCTTWAETGEWTDNCWLGIRDDFLNSGNYVTGEQWILIRHGIGGSSPSGTFNEFWHNTTIDYQAVEGLSPLDGIVGPNTWDHLRGEMVYQHNDGTWKYFSVAGGDPDDITFRMSMNTTKWWTKALDGVQFARFNTNSPI